MEKTSKFIYFVICYVFFIFTDLYLSNILVDKLIHGYRLSNPVFSLNYIKNTGAAFSILQNSRELHLFLSRIINNPINDCTCFACIACNS